MSADHTGDSSILGLCCQISCPGLRSPPSVMNSGFSRDNYSTGDASFTSAVDVSSSSDDASGHCSRYKSSRTTTTAPPWPRDQTPGVSPAQLSSHSWDSNGLSPFLINSDRQLAASHSSPVLFDSAVVGITPAFQDSSVTSISDRLVESSRTELIPITSADTYRPLRKPSPNVICFDETEPVPAFSPPGSSDNMWAPSSSDFSTGSSCPLSCDALSISPHSPNLSLNTHNEANDHVSTIRLCSNTNATHADVATEVDNIRPAQLITTVQPKAVAEERQFTGHASLTGSGTVEYAVQSIMPHHQTVAHLETTRILQPLVHSVNDCALSPRYTTEIVDFPSIDDVTTASSVANTPVVTFGSSASAFRKLVPIDSSAHLVCSPRTTPVDDVCINGTQPLSVVPSSTFDSIAPSLNNQIPQSLGETDKEVEIASSNKVFPDHYFNSHSNLLSNMSRYSPAQVVAFTGGPPEHILRQLEYGQEKAAKVPQRTQTAESSSSAPNSSLRIATRIPAPVNEPPTIDIQVQVNARLAPTTPELVAASSERIFGNFLTETYRLEVTASAKATVNGATTSVNAVTNINADSAGLNTCDASASTGIASSSYDPDPLSEEFASIPRAAPDSMEAMVAHNLARLGDEINRQYGYRLDSMIKILPVDECPIETFSNVARILFSRGPTNWGQVVALFCFGYRLVMRRFRSGLLAAFYQVCRSLLSFCSQMNVFTWIAAQGGWRIVQFLTMRSRAECPEERVDEAGCVPGSSFRDNLLLSRFIRDDWTLEINRRSATAWLVGLFTIATALYIYRRSSR